MKKLLLTILLTILISTVMFSQTEWEYVGLTGNEIFDIEIDGDENIYAALSQVYKSSDGGATWEIKNNGLPSSGGLRLDHHNNILYLATIYGLYKSTNGGDYWFRIAQSIPFNYFDEVNVITNGYVFASVFNMGTGGVFRSTDDGVTWEATSYTGFGAHDIGINANGVMFLGNGTASWYGIQKSFDLGMNWEWVLPYIAATALEYLTDGSVLAGAISSPNNTAGIYKTTTNGSTWFNTNTFNDWNNHFFDFVLDTNDDIYVSVIGMETGVYLSTDSGVSWEYRGLSNVNGVSCLAIDSSGYLYAGTGSNGIFRTPGRTTPVELISFSAAVNEKNVELSWITATETNNQGFEIHKKELGVGSQESDWLELGFIPGHGTTTESKQYSFTDNDVQPGSYEYRLKQIDYDGSFEYSNEIEVVVDFTPKEFSLSQNYPNPFNPATVISYQLPVTGNVSLKVFDVLGNEVATLVNGQIEAGTHRVEFDASTLKSGVYFYRIESSSAAGGFAETKKLVLLK